MDPNVEIVAPSKTVSLSGIEFDIFTNRKNTLFGDDDKVIQTDGQQLTVSAVFVMHGRLQNRDTVSSICNEIAQALNDTICISFDNPNHGSLAKDIKHNQGWEQGNLDHAVHMYGQIRSAVSTISMAIDLLPALLGLEAFHCVGVAGVSQGGHAALVAAALEPRVDAVVSFIGSGDYELNMKMRYDRYLKRYERTKAADTPSPPTFQRLYPNGLAKLVATQDPVNRVTHIAEAGCIPILMLNGASDKLVPLECNQKFESLLRPSYDANGYGDRLKLLPIKDVKHSVTSEMVSLGVQWFGLWLSRGNGSSAL